MTTESQYFQNTKQYNQHLEKLIEHNYDIVIKFPNLLAWGYTTTSYYLETNKGNFVARISKYSKEKYESINYDIEIANLLQRAVPVSQYKQNVQNEYLSIFTDFIGQECILRLSDHIEGVQPFVMNDNLIQQVCETLYKLHFELPVDIYSELRKILPICPNSSKKTYFLHGDLTPTNTLFSYNKLVRILDFEYACFGPLEYDLARTAVFSWFFMQENSYFEILTKCIEFYAQNNSVEIDQDRLIEFSQKHMHTNLDNIKNAEKKFHSKEEWQVAFEFAKKMSDLFYKELRETNP